MELDRELRRRGGVGRLGRVFAREGWTYVGVTNSNVPIAFLQAGCRLGGIIPVANCRQRYATLSLPENGQAYDALSQIAHALKQRGASSPLPEKQCLL